MTMDAAAVMHCRASLVLDCNKGAGGVQWSTRNRGRGEWTRLKTTTTEHSASSCSFLLAKSELSFQSLLLEGQTPYPRSPSFSTPSRRPVKSSPFSDEKAALVEEEQKLLLKKKAEEIVSDLRGTCIFLVGMMGSGKTTVGKQVADALGYYFFDSDKLVEDAAGGITVQQMFEEGSEEEFRNAESEVLMQLSSMGRLVVATGGGAVVRPQNWSYLRHGITVWLDVPLEALAKRVVAVGCESRPLLGQVSPDNAYDQALDSLADLFQRRVDYYKNADASVSLTGLATMTGLDDVTEVTPGMLAVQVLEEIATLIRKRRSLEDRSGMF